LPLPWVRRQVDDVVRDAVTEAAANPRKGSSPIAPDVEGTLNPEDPPQEALSRGRLISSSYHFQVHCPVLEVHAEDMLLMKVSKHLVSGRILLHAGNAVSSDFHISSHHATFKV
jgi:hypothetical protein